MTLQLIIGIALLVITGLVQAAEPVGKTVFARGAATAQLESQAPRLLGNRSPLYEGDVITIGRRSFAILKFTDGTRMTLRPNTVFKIEKYVHEATTPKKQVKKKPRESRTSALFRLFKGGFRAISGLIAKRNPRAMRVKTAVATIGIRGTDFSVRLCDEECAKTQRRASQTASPRTRVIGRVAYQRGKLTATNKQGTRRRIVTGGAFFEGDILATAPRSVAVLAFRDKSRITLSPNSRFKIERYRMAKKKATKSSAFFRLLRGGMRTLTGLIGKRNPRRYRVNTAVATIGIRGTGFDLICQGRCETDPAVASTQLIPRPLDLLRKLIPAAHAASVSFSEGLLIVPWLGEIVVSNNTGETFLSAGVPAFVADINSAPVLDGFTIPDAMLEELGPRPDRFEIPDDMFSTAEPVGLIGLFVTVNDDGHVTVDNIDLGQGEALFADGKILIRLEEPPLFLVNDPYFVFSPEIDVPSGLLFGDELPGVDGEPAECKVPSA